MVIEFAFPGHQTGISRLVGTDNANIVHNQAEVHIHAHNADEPPILIQRRYIGYHIHVYVLVIIGFHPDGLPGSFWCVKPAHMFHIVRVKIQYLRQRLFDERFHPLLFCIEKAAVSGYFICQFRCNAQIIADNALAMAHDVAHQLFHLGYILPTHRSIGTDHIHRRHPVCCLIRKNSNGSLDIGKLVIQET